MSGVADDWYTYMVVASDTSLYTGASTDPDRRVAEHNAGRGAKCLRGKLPVHLCWQSDPISQSAALRLEAKIKRLSSARKWAIIGGGRCPNIDGPIGAVRDVCA